MHKATPKIEGELGKRKKGNPVFAQQPVVEWVILKRVRFAANQDDNNVEVPEPTLEPAPSNLPAEAASSSSAPVPSVNPAVLASATEVFDQVMSEGASSSFDAAVRLTMKRSSDNSNPESEAKRLHAGHSMQVVMLLDDSDVSHAVEWCGEVCLRKETFLVDVNDWDCQSRWCNCCLLQSGGVAKKLMSNESRLPDFVATDRNSNGNLQRNDREVCAKTHKSGPSCPNGGEGFERQDGSL